MIYLGADHRGFKLKEDKNFWPKAAKVLKIWENSKYDPNDEYAPTSPNEWREKCPRNRKKIKAFLVAVQELE